MNCVRANTNQKTDIRFYKGEFPWIAPGGGDRPSKVHSHYGEG